MGSTPEGADWCIKALHPSDPLTQIRGIPDMSTATSLCMNYQTTFTLSPQPSAVGTWSFDASLLPHPVNFMTYKAADSVATIYGDVLNAQISGDTHKEKVQWLTDNCQQWRLAYAGVTITQDGPDLANQGTMVVAQCPVSPNRYYCSADDPTLATPSGTSVVEVYTEEDLPSFTSSQTMPSAYFEQSKKGAYIPLKLTRTAQKWVSQSDLVNSGASSRINANGVYCLPGSVPQQAWPHYGLDCLRTTRVEGSPYTGMFTLVPSLTSPMLNDVFAHISAKNLATTTSFTFFFRFGLEFRVQPSSTLSPQLKLAPRYDATALDTYYAVSRELKDAYEASYNDLGKLWGVVSGVAKDIFPIIRGLGPIGSSVATVGKGIVKAGDAIQQRRQTRPKTPKKKSTPKVKAPPKLPPR